MDATEAQQRPNVSVGVGESGPSAATMNGNRTTNGKFVRQTRQKMLAAFLGRNEILQRAHGLTLFNTPAERATFWNHVGEAQTARRGLPTEPWTAPRLTPLPGEAEPYVRQLVATEAFQEAYGGLSCGFALVELARLIPVQTFVNLEPQQIPPALDDLQGLLKYCLPLDSLIPAEAVLIPNGVRFCTDRYGHSINNVRARLKGNKVIVTFEHVNLLKIVKIGDRLIALNGNHRAFELLEAGHEVAPALVVQYGNANEVQWPQGALGSIWNADFMLTSPRPPIIRDFLSPLAVEYEAPILPSFVDVYIGSPPAAQAALPQVNLQLAVPQVPIAPPAPQSGALGGR